MIKQYGLFHHGIYINVSTQYNKGLLLKFYNILLISCTCFSADMFARMSTSTVTGNQLEPHGLFTLLKPGSQICKMCLVAECTESGYVAYKS